MEVASGGVTGVKGGGRWKKESKTGDGLVLFLLVKGREWACGVGKLGPSCGLDLGVIRLGLVLVLELGL